MAKIHSPNKEYTGISASVKFIDGTGETEDKQLIEWFESKGYTVEYTENKEEATDTGKEPVEEIGQFETEKVIGNYTEESLKEIKERKDLMKIAETLGYTAPHNIATETLIKKILELQN